MMSNRLMAMTRRIATLCLLLPSAGCSCPDDSEAVSGTVHQDEGHSAGTVAGDAGKVTLNDSGLEYELTPPVAEVVTRFVRACEGNARLKRKGLHAADFVLDTPDLKGRVTLWEIPKLLSYRRTDGPVDDRGRGKYIGCALSDSDHRQLMEIISTTAATQVGCEPYPGVNAAYLARILPDNATRMLLDYRGKQYVVPVESIRGILVRGFEEAGQTCALPREYRILARCTVDSPQAVSVFVVLEDYAIISQHSEAASSHGVGAFIGEERHAELKKAIEAAVAAQVDE